jgi:uncharacterized membrane protein
MTTPAQGATDRRVEQIIGRLLQIGVLAAACVVSAGAVGLLVRHGAAPADYNVFRSEPEYLRSLGGIVRGTLAFDSRAVVQLGLLLLIATPVARVALTLVAFAIQRDRTYALLAFLVLALLTYSLLFGG